MSETDQREGAEGRGKIIHIPESCRWYDGDGNAVLSVLAKNGMPRSPTLRDARKYTYFPSYSNISHVVANKRIENWVVQKVLEMAWKTPIIEGEEEEKWIERVSMLSQEERAIPRDRGTEIHAAIQCFLAGEDYEHDAIIDNAVKQIQTWFENKKVVSHEPEKSFVNVKLGYGGKADDVAHLELGNVILCDVKSTKTPPKKAYDDWRRQLGAYKAGLILPSDTECFNLVISQLTGDLFIYPWTNFDIAEGLQVFLAMRDLWFLYPSPGSSAKKYDPRRED